MLTFFGFLMYVFGIVDTVKWPDLGQWLMCSFTLDIGLTAILGLYLICLYLWHKHVRKDIS